MTEAMDVETAAAIAAPTIRGGLNSPLPQSLTLNGRFRPVTSEVILPVLRDNP